MPYQDRVRDGAGFIVFFDQIIGIHFDKNFIN
jgi:hypothetical protein